MTAMKLTRGHKSKKYVVNEPWMLQVQRLKTIAMSFRLAGFSAAQRLLLPPQPLCCY
jgi:hypothetical protein